MSMYLLVFSIVLTLIGTFTRTQFIATLSYIPMFFAIYRFFSKDTQKRSMENYKFAIFISPLYSKFKKGQSRYQASKTHKYFKCPECKVSLRVPKGRGKIRVTCPKCKGRFEKKT